LEGEDRNKGELVGMPIGQQPDPIASLVEMLKSGTLAKVSETSLSSFFHSLFLVCSAPLVLQGIACFFLFLLFALASFASFVEREIVLGELRFSTKLTKRFSLQCCLVLLCWTSLVLVSR